MSFTLKVRIKSNQSIVVLLALLNITSVPVEQWVDDGLKVHKRVFVVKSKNLHLAAVSWIIDDKQVHSVICIHIQETQNMYG